MKIKVIICREKKARPSACFEKHSTLSFVKQKLLSILVYHSCDAKEFDIFGYAESHRINVTGNNKGTFVIAFFK